MPDPLRVLYVDDEPGLLEIGKLFLEQSGLFSVDIIPSAPEALSLLNVAKYDAIISDYQMPGMDGIEFLKSVRASGNAIPFILFTGRGREEIVIQALNERANFYLQKGGDPEAQFVELVHKIQISVEHHRAAEKIQALNRLYSVLSATNKAIFRIQTKEEFFFEICRILVETGGFRMAWIGLADPKKKIIRPVASAGHVDGYLDYIHISTEDIPEGRGPTGTAFREGKYFWSNDITLDPLMEPWRENALKRGYLANAAFAFALGTNNAGTLSVYAPVTGFFDPPIIDLLEELAVDISFYLRAIDDQNERILAINARRVSEERFHGLFDTINSGVAIYEVRNEGKSGKDYIIKDFNKTALKIEGKKKEEVIGKSLFDLRPTIDEYGLIPVFRKVWETGDPEFFPGKVYIDEKFSNWYENRVFRLPSGEIVAVYDDVTERKTAEQKLVSAHENLNEAHRLAHIGTWDWIIETDTVTWSEELCNIAGWDPSLPAPTYAELPRIYTPDSWEHLSAAVTNALTTGEPYNLELELIRPDGSIRWTNAFGGVQRDETGKAIGLHGTVQDITERKQAEETLREANEYLNNLFDYANAPIIVWDPNFVITRFNHAFEDLTLISEQEVIGQRLDILFPKESRDTSLLQIKKTLKGERWKTVEIPILIKDGSVRTVLWNSANILDPVGRIISTIAQGVDITERKVAEETLAETNAYLNNLFDYANAPIIVWDPDFVITRFNHAFEDLTLISAQEIIGQRLDILFPKESRDTSLLQIKKTLEGERWETVEIPILVKDGSVRTVLWNSANILDPVGRIISTIAQGVDITEGKRAEAALAESFATFSTVMDCLDALVYVADMKTHEILFVNHYGRKIWGDLTGKICWKSLQVDQNGPCPFCTNEKLLDSDGNPIGVLIWEFRNTITGQWYECHDSAIQWTDGRIVRIEIATDITERKRSEQELRESEEKYRALFTAESDGIFVVDKETGTIIDCNDAVTSMYGYQKDEMIGRPNTAISAEPGATRAATSALPGFIPERHHKKKDGSVFPVEITANAISINGRDVIVAAVRDITERKRAEDALRQANRQLSLLSGITRHDIRNQLLTLNSYLALSRKTLGDTEKTREYILREERVAKTIERQILFTREYENLGASSPVWQNIGACIEPAFKGLALTGIDLDVTGLENTEILADTLLPRVFFNLADNALRHGGEAMAGIRIFSRESGTGLVIVFEDDGAGVATGDKEMIFERGYGKNTGYGLFLIREILALTGITVTETGEPGKGARFEMAVPGGMWCISAGNE